jgi:hypothetical protein
MAVYASTADVPDALIRLAARYDRSQEKPRRLSAGLGWEDVKSPGLSRLVEPTAKSTRRAITQPRGVRWEVPRRYSARLLSRASNKTWCGHSIDRPCDPRGDRAGHANHRPLIGRWRSRGRRRGDGATKERARLKKKPRWQTAGQGSVRFAPTAGLSRLAPYRRTCRPASANWGDQPRR